MEFLKRINLTNAIIEFVAIFVCFLSLYFPLRDLEPYRHEFNKLHEDYIYTFNKDYSALFDDDAKIARYHYEYGEQTTLYTNRIGAELGAPVLAEAPFLAFYTFEIDKPDTLILGKKYDLTTEKIIKNRNFISKYGTVSFEADYIVVDDAIEEKYECEYKIYPSNNNSRILDEISFSDSFSARGKTIKSTVFMTTNTLGILLVLFAIIPATTLMIALSFYYSIRIDRESKQIFIDNVFYRKKASIVTNMFLKYFSKVFLEVIIAGTVSYFIFIGNDLLLLLIPIFVFSLVEAIYLFFFLKIKINSTLKEGVDMKYVD